MSDARRHISSRAWWRVLVLTAIAPLAAARGEEPRPPCRVIVFEGARHLACRFVAGKDDIRLFWADEQGRPLGSFQRLERWLPRRGLRLRFAMNAGMFTPTYRPAGLYVEQGRELKALNLKKGHGNFHLLPNGVFFIGKHRAGVMESRAFTRARKRLKVRHATQSGPMLVINGRLHPRFRKASDSLKIRNGVGVMADGRTIWFAISRDAVNFHHFARLFRDVLKTPDALFLDGGISQIYVPGFAPAALPFSLRPLGPMVAVVEGKEHGDE